MNRSGIAKFDVKKEEDSSSSSDRILNFDSFVVKLASFTEDEPWKEHWNIFEQHDGLCFYRLSRDESFSNVTMTFKILVNKDLNVMVYKNEIQGDRTELNWVLKGSKLELWSQFYRLLDYYQTDPGIQQNKNPIYRIERALETINSILCSGDINGIIEPFKRELESTLVQLNQDVKKEVDDADEEEMSVAIPEFLSFDNSNFDPHEAEMKAEPIDDQDDLVSSSLNESDLNTSTKKNKKVKGHKSDSADEITKCEYCDKTFPSRALCNRHIYGSHVSFILFYQSFQQSFCIIKFYFLGWSWIL